MLCIQCIHQKPKALYIILVSIVTMRRFVIGDIHGRVVALKEVLTLSNFNYKDDLLVLLGDVVDGGYNTYEVVEELLKIDNIVFVIGNHDKWFIDNLSSGWSGDIWLNQGGKNTLDSYRKASIGGMVPVTHQEFFNSGHYYYILNNMLFVHGGFNPRLPIEENSMQTLLWDRSLIEKHKNGRKEHKFDKIFVGHTTTQFYGSYKPLKFGKLWMIDTGAGWTGKLTMMNIDTEEYFQSKIQEPAR